jgi:conjugal transfer/entry exclusion protein
MKKGGSKMRKATLITVTIIAAMLFIGTAPCFADKAGLPALADRVSSLETNVTTLQSQVAALQNAIDALQTFTSTLANQDSLNGVQNTVAIDTCINNVLFKT